MKYAVEARLFSTGLIVFKVRPAEDGEEDHREHDGGIDIWVDVFDTEQEARAFAAQYRR